MTHHLVRTAAAVTMSLVASNPALAHAHLRSETPAADTTAPSPDGLTLQFTEGLEPRFSGVTVTGPTGSAVPTGPGRLAPEDPARLVVPLAGKLAPGAYRVDWHAVATDGHKTSGSYRFMVAP